MVILEDFNKVKLIRACDGKIHECKCKEMFPVLNMFLLTKKRKEKLFTSLNNDLVSVIPRGTNHFNPN